ncbi:MAG: cell wall metabolism sensor histidine kinase WalK [Clostridiales bacterium]|jgi:two-component system sensor histidine kinase VicK|nr:cell wall metabolism sensor histidine kinase WalK [Clostridiales bacterium]
MKSIKLKLVMIYLTLVFIVMIVSGVFMLLQTKSNEINKAEHQLKEYASAIEGQILQSNSTQEEFQAAFRNWKLPQGIQGYILDGRRQNQTLAPEESVHMRFLDSSIISALSGQDGFNASKKDMDANNTLKEWITYAAPVFSEDEESGDAQNVLYVLYMRMDASAMNENLSEITVTICLMVLLALLLTAVLGFLLANTLTRPIILLTRQAKNMAQGSLNQEIPVYGQDEIGQLTETINGMAKALSHTISTIESEKNKVEAVLNNLTDGVLAYDSRGNLIHANAAGIELLSLGDLLKIPASAVLSHLGFENRDYSKESNRKESRESKESTIAIGDKFISSILTPYYNALGQVEGIAIVIQDVTKLTKLDNMRKEFVANVSHELRTPLTTVKTYTETLLDGALEEPSVAEGFLKVVFSEAERMTLLVQDLLELSRLDNKQLKLNLEIVDLNGLLRHSVKQNIVLAEKKRQKMLFTPAERECFIEADENRINQVLTNIISNSVKYSPEDAAISISVETEADYYRVYVKDNGMGIPREDLQRIFERFYRVDKARSRAMGGTGLGLAIAKEIMEAHGFRITARSELGKGATMILRFTRCDTAALFLDGDEDGV